MTNIWTDGIMGLVIGDACGVPVEFMSREELKKNPVRDMREYGTHMQPRGTWSDDSSMALANLASLHKGYDINDIAQQFSNWESKGMYTPFGEAFDIGNTCSYAIYDYQNTGNPKTSGRSGENDNGNGSLMRILPMCIFAFEKGKKGEITTEKAIEMIHETSGITHAHLRSKMACGLYYFCVKAIIDNRKKLSVIDCLQKGFNEGFAFYGKGAENTYEINIYSRLRDMKRFKAEEENTIKTTGYVVDSFEAAIWSMLNSKDFKTCILKAVNLGDDTDTVGAIAGGLAGLFYGYDNIPIEWRDCIIKKEWILELCNF